MDDHQNNTELVPDLIKNLSKVVLKTNSDILELAEASCKGETSEMDNSKEKDVEKKVKLLEDAIKSLEGRTDYVSERFLSSINNTIESAKSILENKYKAEEEVVNRRKEPLK